MKKAFMLYLLSAFCGFAQEPSDYYNKPVQELREKTGICWDTAIAHNAGYRQCNQELLQWADRNRDKYGFLSVAFKDSGVVQITLLADCRTLRSGSVTEYFMVLTSRSNSLKIAFENIRSHAKDCQAGFRNSLKTELAHLVSALPDSITWSGKLGYPSRGLGYTGFTDEPAKKISATDSIFAAIKADSARLADSIARMFSRADSIVRADSPAHSKIEAAPVDTLALQREVDSIVAVVGADSSDIEHRDQVIFKYQPILQDNDKTVGAKLECLQDLLARKKRKTAAVVEYLRALQKLCLDKQSFYYTVRKTIAAEEKAENMRNFKKAQENGTKVQAMLDKLSQ
ncbi:MAG TPA: hypothetical protein VLX68_10515 [Chitinivibrionales bacterium]|nr:hypothetical protein [Chitinivibrionales bacterium]